MSGRAKPDLIQNKLKEICLIDRWAPFPFFNTVFTMQTYHLDQSVSHQFILRSFLVGETPRINIPTFVLYSSLYVT